MQLGPKVGQALVVHPKIPLISFTGGTATGKHIITSSAPFYKRLSLELGGKNPNIIFADANLDQCVPTTVRKVPPTLTCTCTAPTLHCTTLHCTALHCA